MHRNIPKQTENKEKAPALAFAYTEPVPGAVPPLTALIYLSPACRRSSFTVRLFWQTTGCPASAPLHTRFI